MWSTCIKFIIFVQSTSFWYICWDWIKRDFATFNHMSSCWEINVLIFLFISGNVISLKTLFVPVPWPQSCQKWLLLRSPDFFALEVRSLFIPGNVAFPQVSRSTLYFWLIPLWPFVIGMGFLRGCILSIHIVWSVLTLKLTEKNVLFKLWSNVTYLQHVYVNGHGICKHELYILSLHERQKIKPILSFTRIQQTWNSLKLKYCKVWGN